MPDILVIATAPTARFARDRTLFGRPESALQASEDPSGFLSQGQLLLACHCEGRFLSARTCRVCVPCLIPGAHFLRAPRRGWRTAGGKGPAWAQEGAGKAASGRGSHARVPALCACARPVSRLATEETRCSAQFSGPDEREPQAGS